MIEQPLDKCSGNVQPTPMQPQVRRDILMGAAGGIIGGLLACGIVMLAAGRNGDWVGFLGSICSAIITSGAALWAGRWAWDAIQLQIAKTDELAQRGEQRAASLAEMYVTSTIYNAEKVRRKLRKINKERFWLDNRTDIKNYFVETQNTPIGPITSDVERHIDKLPVELVAPVRNFITNHSLFDTMINEMSIGYMNAKSRRISSDEYVGIIDSRLDQLKLSSYGFSAALQRWRMEHGFL